MPTNVTAAVPRLAAACNAAPRYSQRLPTARVTLAAGPRCTQAESQRRLKSLLRCSCCAAPAAAAVLCRCAAPAVWRAAGSRHAVSSYASAGCATAKAELTSSCICQGSAAQGQTAARDPGKTRASATACKWGGRRRGGEARRCMQRARQRPHPRSLPHRCTQQAHLGCACLAS